ncbi:Pre-rRNA-processing protein TSR2-like protein [Trichoplax sp. H2]|nr:Pre-rRNA-processing protein TSR2-like protein [Trichoplax sp. H2]|eukprot:RDD36353.1 Pre-rRNA-processing protein TSR2-like protein [Trichoplax sp. H2]
MMSNSVSLQNQFEQAVTSYLRQWPVVELIIANGFAGSLTNEKVDWLITTAVPQMFYENGNLFPDDVEYYLSHILFHEFDTVVEDGSLSDTSRKLIDLHDMYKKGNETLLQDQIILYSQTVTQQQGSEIIDSMNAMQLTHDPSVEQSRTVNQAESNANVNNTDQGFAQNNEDNDGWQVVQSRKNKER